jgi:hypothetical protein
MLNGNRSVVALIKNPVLSSQSKHIEVKYHLVTESAEQGKIEVKLELTSVKRHSYEGTRVSQVPRDAIPNWDG